jgi:hypothetical protein
MMLSPHHKSLTLLLTLICWNLASVPSDSLAGEAQTLQTQVLAPLHVDPVLLGLPPLKPPSQKIAATPVPLPSKESSEIKPVALPLVEVRSIDAEPETTQADETSEERPMLNAACTSLSANRCSASTADPLQQLSLRIDPLLHELAAQPRDADDANVSSALSDSPALSLRASLTMNMLPSAASPSTKQLPE